jgi:hypothetical protein
MAAFFSGTDDKDELGDPGLHIVVGSISVAKKTYTMQASITAHFKRHLIPFDKILDATPIECTFNPAVLTMIREEALRSYAHTRQTYKFPRFDKEKHEWVWEIRDRSAQRLPSDVPYDDKLALDELKQRSNELDGGFFDDDVLIDSDFYDFDNEHNPLAVEEVQTQIAEVYDRLHQIEVGTQSSLRKAKQFLELMEEMVDYLDYEIR